MKSNNSDSWQRGAHARKTASSVRANLIQEYANRKKISAFHDRRIRMSSDTSSMVARFSRAHYSKRAQKKRLFSLSEHQVELTHHGRAIDFDSPNDDDELHGGSEEEEGPLSASHVYSSHFGGPGSDAHPKTKTEVMKEIIAKSKHFKAIRQQQHTENEEMQQELDAEFADIRSLLSFSSQKSLAPPDEFEAKVETLERERKAQAASVRTQSVAEIACAETSRLARQEVKDHSDSDTESTKSDFDHPEVGGPKTLKGGHSITAHQNLLISITDKILCGDDSGKEGFFNGLAELESSAQSMLSHHKAVLEFSSWLQEKFIPDWPKEPSLIFKIGLIIERIYSCSDARHSVVTPFMLKLASAILELIPLSLHDELLRTSLLLIRLAGSRRWIVPEAKFALEFLADGTKVEQQECVVGDWELFFMPLDTTRIKVIARAALECLYRLESEALDKARAPRLLAIGRPRFPRLLEPVLAGKKETPLRRVHRKELKGALRELRRDTHAIANVKYAEMRKKREAANALKGSMYSLQ